jgi:16S rRNA processing protein RimM
MGADERSMLQVGKIMRPHGLKGQLSVDLWTDRLERLAPGTILETDRGPLTVTHSQPHQQRHLVSFEEITTRDEADKWRGVVLSAPRLDLADVIWIDELYGAEVITTDGIVRGIVVAVEEYPASDMLILDTGALVPLTFATEVEPRTKIVIDAPEGLFE